MNRIQRKTNQRWSQNEERANTSRASRAVLRREEQKKEREKLQFRKRLDSRVHTPATVSSSICSKNYYQSIATSHKKKKMTKDEKENRQKMRYFEMLAWKENKMKRIEKEKKKRTQPFKTGLYQPETPSFLVSGDPNVGSQCLCRSTKKPKINNGTPSTGLHGSKALVNKVLNFKTGVTPFSTHKKTFNPVHSGTSRVSRLKAQRKDLGVTPIAKTPKVLRSRTLNKDTKPSFAPDSFAFRPLKNVQTYAIERKNENCSIQMVPEVKASSRLFKSGNQGPILVGSRSESVGDSISEEGRESLPHTDESFKDNSLAQQYLATKSLLTLNLPDLINECLPRAEVNEVPKLPQSTQLEKEAISEPNATNTQKDETPDVPETEKNEDDHHCSSVDAEHTNEPSAFIHESDVSKSTCKSRKSMSKRSSNAHCVTPMRTRLRSRTPCSRSTRRSHSAHCDRLSLGSVDALLTSPLRFSPKKRHAKISVLAESNGIDISKDGSSRLSKQTQPEIANTAIKTPKVSFATQNAEIITEITPKNNNDEAIDIFKTPKGILSSKKKVTTVKDDLNTPVEKSPWVLKERSSSKQKRRPMNPIEEMMDSMPFDISGHIESVSDFEDECQGKTEPNEDKENVNIFTSFSPYLKPSDEPLQDVFSPDVWGEDEKESLIPLPAMIDPTPKSTTNKKKQLRLSVTFANKDKTPKKYPNTPIRRSTRLLNRVSLLPGLSPDEENTNYLKGQDFTDKDLISWNTPTKPSNTTRRSKRLANDH